MKTLLLSAAALCCSLWMGAQLPDAYHTFIQHASTGILLQQKLPKPQQFWTPSSAQQAWLTLRRACIDSNTVLPGAEQMAKRLSQAQRSSAAIHLGAVCMAYQYLDSTQFNKADYIIHQKQVQIKAGARVPIQEAWAFLPLTPECRIDKGTTTFLFDPQLVVAAPGTTLNSIAISTNGKNWHTLRQGESVALMFEGLLYIKASFGGRTHETNMQWRSTNCASELPDPSPDIPWQYLDDAAHVTSPWEISTTTDNGTIVSGNAYYLPSGAFDKPFIFVEGIDFSYYQGELRNGEFGWCEFTSGSNGYEFISNLAPALQQLHEQEFDIILLDFADGAADLRLNSALLQHLLRIVNLSKQGTHPNILAGASMGGVISRHALATMEQQNNPHCVGVWISLDAPHAGANIPFGLQQMIFSLSHFNAAASNFIENYLRRPAAKQLMILQYDRTTSEQEWYTPSMHLQFFEELNALGFPRTCKSLGVTNGSLRGIKLWPNDYDFLMDENCEVLACSSGPEARFFITSTYGDPWYNDWWGNASTSDYSVSSQLVVSNGPSASEIVVSGWLGGLLGVGQSLCGLDKQIHTTFIRKNIWPYDNAAGGTRKSIGQLAWAINASDALDGQCTDVSIYKGAHCFVPTASALGIVGAHPQEAVLNIQQQRPHDIPFDEVMGPMNDNEPHSFVSSSLATRIVQEALSLTPNAQQGLPELLTLAMPNQGQFNMGAPHLSVISSLKISDGGCLWINAYQPLHFGQDPSQSVFLGSRFKAYILPDCSNSVVRVAQGGRMVIGDPTGASTAELVVRKGGHLIVDEGGELIISPGSRLRVEEGGIVELNNGSQNKVEGTTSQFAEIELHTGGRIYMSNATLVLNGEQCKFKMLGGTLMAREGESAVRGQGMGCGQVVAERPNSGEWYIHSGASLRLEGDFSSDMVMELYANADLSINGGGNLTMYNGSVRMVEASRLTLNTANAVITRLRSYADGDYNHHPIIECFNGSSAWTTCELEDVSLSVDAQTMLLDRSQFHSQECSANFLRSQLTIKACQFDDYPVVNKNCSGATTVSMSEFQHTNTESAVLWYEISDTRLIAKSNVFKGGAIQLRKTGGAMALGCNRFSNSRFAIYALTGCMVEMSGERSTGRNIFHDNDVHILLRDAGPWLLENGENVFDQFQQRLVSGNLRVPCGTGCAPNWINANGNYWGTSAASVPTANNTLSSAIMLNSSMGNAYGCAVGSMGCSIYLRDDAPIFTIPECYPTKPFEEEKEEGRREWNTVQGNEETNTNVVFPNPLRGDKLTVTFGEHKDEQVTLRLLDGSGRAVKTWRMNVSGTSVSLDVPSEISTGLYILEWTTNSGTQHQSLIIER